MNIIEIKKQREVDTNNLMTSLGVFWAFSNKQFDENKTPLQEGEKYVDIGMGGYIPKHNVEALLDGMKEIENTFKKQVKENKQREAYILYELNNHEAYYTNDIDPTLEALGDGYTLEEVQAVYKKYKSQKHIVTGLDNQMEKYA